MLWSNPDTLPLSHGQQALWLMYRENPQSSAYNVSLPLKFAQRLDPIVLQQALESLVQQHPVLGMVFAEHAGIPQQTPGLAHIQLQTVAAACFAKETLLTTLQEIAAQPFDLTHSGFRATLLEDHDNGSVLLLDIHHIMVDGLSLGIIAQDFLNAYASLQQGIKPVWQAASVYADYIACENRLLTQKRGARLKNYWHNQLGGELPTLQLPTDYSRPPLRRNKGAYCTFTLEPETTQRLEALAKQYNSRLFNVLLTAYQILLHRYTAQTDIWVGVPTSVSRHEKSFQSLVGYLVNMMVVTAHLPTDKALSFTALLAQTSRQMFTGLLHQPYPFSLLVQELVKQRDRSHTPLVQTSFSFENESLLQQHFSADNLCADVVDMPQMAGQFDLSVTFTHGQTLQGMLMYNTDLFKADTIERMAGHFSMLLTSIVKNPEQCMGDLNLLTLADIHQLQAWNNTYTDYPQNQTITSVFEAQVARTPRNKAVVFEGNALTYVELNARANQLAQVLIQQGVVADTLVGLCVERSLEMVIGLLAILKAGGAYVPIDPAYPAERQAFMLQDSQVAVLLTQTHLQKELPLSGLNPQPPILGIDAASLYADQPDSNPLLHVEAHHLAYVIYTSGSTGNPKGVKIEHRSVINLLSAYAKAAPLSGFIAGSSTCPFSFDVFVWECFSTLCFGHALHVIPTEITMQPLKLVEYLQYHQIAQSYFPPALLEAVVAQFELTRQMPLQRLLVGVESIKEHLLQRFRNLSGSLSIINGYGPTETTVCATFYNFKVDSLLARNTPIGSALANYRVYLCDSYHQPVPLGTIGEICIAGTGLARGYLNRPELTAEKFLNVELLGQNERIYRTGDLARWLPDGSLEYLGRIDHQVKLRGFRIELGEIEAVLTQHAAIQNALVILDQAATQPRLVAYVASNQATTALESELRTYLKTCLPDYMIPAVIMVLAQFPLTPNGKMDRKALPQPSQGQVRREPPRNTIEQYIAHVWQHMLQQTVVGIDDNFFDIGGHSLLLMQVLHHLHEQYPRVTIVDLFNYPTIRSLAIHLAQTHGMISLASNQTQNQQAAQNRVQQRLARQATVQQRNRRVS